LPEAKFGVGIYIVNNDGSHPEWDPRAYRASVVQDNAGTILLCELPSGRNMAGNDMPSFCAGLVNSDGHFPGLMPDCFQMGSSSYNYGAIVYSMHGHRFNYLFHDGHISTLKYADTVGTGTEKAPRGMWTMIAGD
jgi:prepilin-type processing-associated H-X9-DG protein